MTDAGQSHSPSTDRKVDRLHTHCLYRIATGKWPEGERLPSVREAERRWGVDRRTVLVAYHRLAEAGLVRRVDRSGFYVASGPELGRLSRCGDERCRSPAEGGQVGRLGRPR